MGKVYNDVQNKDDVLFRNLIVGTLHALRDNIFWYNIINGERTKVDVPIYYTVAGNERFLSDIFLNSDELMQDGKATGVYNKFPRAHVSLNSLSLQEEYLTNKFKRANYLKREGQEIKTYNAEFIEAPFKLNYEMTLFLDSHIDIYKAIQNIFENLYKNVTFYVDVFSVKVPCHFSIPSDIEKTATIPFSFTDKKENKISLNIECQCSYPIFKDNTTGNTGDLDTSVFAGNRMGSIDSNMYIVSNISDDTDSTGSEITVTKDVWPSGNNSNALPD